MGRLSKNLKPGVWRSVRLDLVRLMDLTDRMTSFRLLYRWIVFLLAVLYCLRMLLLGDWEQIGGPLRYLTVWALFCSFFAASRMIALELGRRTQRWDGFVAMTSVLNTMVVFLYWRLYFADPYSVQNDGELGQFYLEMYLHAVGPALQLIDSLFIHRGHRKPLVATGWLVGVIASYVVWVEVFVQRVNDIPAGSVTSGLPYPFLNNLDLADRMAFYTTNVVIGIVLIAVYAVVSWAIRRSALPHTAPEARHDSPDTAGGPPDRS